MLKRCCCVALLFFPSIAFAEEVFKLVLEEPVNAEWASGIASIRGWAVAESGIERIEIYVDGVLESEAPYGSQRRDVEAVYPNVAGSLHSGFSRTMNYNTLDTGNHTITARAVAGDGRWLEDSTTFYVSTLGKEFIADYGYPDFRRAVPFISSYNGTIRLFGLEATPGETYDVTLRWSTAKQGFEIIWAFSTEYGAYPEEYMVEHAYRQEFFVIAGAEFTATNSCPLSKGAMVIFTRGSPGAGCETVTVEPTSYFLHPMPCELRCE